MSVYRGLRLCSESALLYSTSTEKNLEVLIWKGCWKWVIIYLITGYKNLETNTYFYSTNSLYIHSSSTTNYDLFYVCATEHIVGYYVAIVWTLTHGFLKGFWAKWFKSVILLFQHVISNIRSILLLACRIYSCSCCPVKMFSSVKLAVNSVVPQWLCSNYFNHGVLQFLQNRNCVVAMSSDNLVSSWIVQWFSWSIRI